MNLGLDWQCFYQDNSTIRKTGKNISLLIILKAAVWFTVTRELKQRRRKRHLKIYLYFMCATLRLFQLPQLLQKWRTIPELNW